MKKAMKIMAMVLFVVSMATLTSCSKSNEKLILGKWKFDSVTATYEGQTFTLTVADIASMFGAEEDVEDVYMEFKDDGKVYMEEESASYTIDGDKLTIVEADERIEMTIIELSKSTMTLEAEEDGLVYDLNFKKV